MRRVSPQGTSPTRFIELKKVLDRLHGPKGCLWDKKQTHVSIIPYLKEEADEFIAEIRAKDFEHMKEELGDILLQVMFHAKIAAKDSRFDIEDVIAALIRKLKRRHPHVFGNVKARTVRQVLKNWNKIKAREKKENKRL